jgi:hypothetical protein
VKISREQDVIAELALTSVLANTPAIPFGAYSAAVLILPAGYVSTTIDIYTAVDETDTFVPLKDASGNAVSMPVSASAAVVLPASCFPCRWLKLKSSADDSSRPATLVRKG